MTSLQLFPKVDHSATLPKDWGTGRYNDDIDVFVPRAPTWHYSGKPIDQYYRLTQLKLSNIRTNDELVPEPHENSMGSLMINRTFPAEHPYSSHIPRTALFPKFDSDMDPNRGVAARAEKPISSEMPANGYNVQIIHKTKGFGDRHEIQEIPKASEKTALEFVGEYGFNQLVKVHNGRQIFYPMPPKTLVPNLQARGPDMKVSLQTANTLRNVERDQWQTTYNRNHTGLGPQNPNQLNNLDSKTNLYDRTGITDDSLYPRSINTFDPPRPFEGRIAKVLIPKPQPMKTAEAANKPVNPNYVRMKTLSEKEEDRLLNGKEYISLPETIGEKNAARWRELQDQSHPDTNLQKVDDEICDSKNVPHKPAGPPVGPEAPYLESTKRDQDKNYQEMEANNRWNVLELHGPSHDISSLKFKMDLATANEKPPTFYGHESKYNEERGGLYKTSYSPEKLAYSLNALQVSGPEIMNTMHSHINSLHLPTRLNYEANDAFRYSRTHSHSQPNLSGDRREAREVVEQHLALKQGQKQMLAPSVETASVKVQEGETINKESTTGDSFNTRKFLQEYNIGKFSRYEPLTVISSENKNLHNVRKASSTKLKSVKFSDNVLVANSLDDGRFRLSSAPVKSSPRIMTEPVRMSVNEPVSTTQYISRQAQYKPDSDNTDDEEFETEELEENPQKVKFTNVESKPDEQVFIAYSNVLRKRPAANDPSTEYRNEFSSRGTNFIPSNIHNSMSFESAYKAQFPAYHIGYKSDSRFQWNPGMGTPRPQTSLLELQNSFEKSIVRKKFLSQFTESNPDLRANSTRGKKHNFYGISGQYLHG